MGCRFLIQEGWLCKKGLAVAEHDDQCFASSKYHKGSWGKQYCGSYEPFVTTQGRDPDWLINFGGKDHLGPPCHLS